MSWAGTQGKDAAFSIYNGYDSAIKLESVNVSWPGGNGALVSISVGSKEVWSGSVGPSSANIDLTAASSGKRNINAGGTGTLTLSFESNAASSGYNITVDTNVAGCSITSSH
jgi:hypothetical protein